MIPSRFFSKCSLKSSSWAWSIRNRQVTRRPCGEKTLKFGYILFTSLDLFSYALEYFFKMITDKSTNSTKKNLLYSKLAKLISFLCTFGFFSIQNLTSSLFVPMMVGTCAKSPSLSMSSGSLGTKSLSTAGCQWMGNIPDTVVSISWASVISLASAWQRGEKQKIP